MVIAFVDCRQPSTVTETQDMLGSEHCTGSSEAVREVSESHKHSMKGRQKLDALHGAHRMRFEQLAAAAWIRLPKKLTMAADLQAPGWRLAPPAGRATEGQLPDESTRRNHRRHRARRQPSLV